MYIRKRYIWIILLALFLLLIFNFFRAFHYEFTSFDGFQYLAMSKSFWSHDFRYKITYRSPVVYLFFYPDVHAARIEILAVYLLIVYLFYLFVKKHWNEKTAFYSTIFYAFCWWSIAFTLNTVVEYFAILFVLAGFLCKNKFLRGVFQGLAFLTRPDSIVFIIPFYLFFEKSKKSALVSFIFMIMCVEIVLDFLFYGSLVPSYVKFAIVNFVKKLPWHMKSSGIYWLHVNSVSPYLLLLPGIYYSFKADKSSNKKFLFLFAALTFLFGFLPATNNRIFFTKFLIFASLSGGIMMSRIKNKIFVVFVISVFLVYNILSVVNLHYPEWHPDFNCIKVECSNFPSLVYLKCRYVPRYSPIGECENGLWIKAPIQ